MTEAYIPQGEAEAGVRILYIDQSGLLGGAELSLFDIARNITGTVLLFDDGPLRERLERAGVKVVVLNAGRAALQIHRSAGAWHLLKALPSFVRLLCQVVRIARGFDVLYANTQKAMIVGAMAGAFCRKPVIWALRDIMSPDHFSWLNRRAAIFCGNRLVTKIVANSMATKEAYIESGGEGDKCEVVYNGFQGSDVPCSEAAWDEDEIPAGAPVIGHFSRLAEWKGQDVLLHALAKIPEAHVIFVGDALFEGDDRFAAQLRQLVQELGLTKRVHWLGFRVDVAALMRRCTIVVHSSTLPEPFGRVIVEGMLAERPVIASALGGAKEIIEDEISGLLTPPRDPTALALAIKRYLGNLDSAREIARRGRLRALQHFSLTSTIQRLEEVFSAILDRKRGKKKGGRRDGEVLREARPTRILFLDQSGQLGGAELMLADIAKRFSPDGQVLLFTDGPFRVFLERQGVRAALCSVGRSTLSVPKSSGMQAWLGAVPGFGTLLLKVLFRSKGFDVIYANTAKALLVGAVVSFLRGRPLIFHLHDIVSVEHFSRMNRRLLVRAASSRALWIIANSGATRAAFIAAGGRASRHVVIYNGFKIERFTGLPPTFGEMARSEFGIGEHPLAVAIGRLTPWKGQHVLLAAAKEIHDLRVLLVGGALFTDEDRAYEARLRAEADSVALRGRVHFAGQREDTRAFYVAADVVVHCSTAPEPFGRVVVEAMLAGRPVIAADAGGVREILCRPELGVMVPPGDAPALARGLRGLLEDRERASRMAAAGQREAQRRFVLRNILDQIEEVVAAVVRK